MTFPLDILFDGPPGPNPGRFVEVEIGGRSVRIGTWISGPGESWALRLDAPPPAEIEAPYPFLRDQYEMPPPECDGDGNDPWTDPEIVACWRPGVREECEYHGDEVVAVCRDADGTGAILLTEFAEFRNAQGREMVTYKRRWRDPDGRVFGKGDYRTCSREKFERMAKGYAFDYTEPEGTE